MDATVTSNLGNVWDATDFEISKRWGLMGFALISRRNKNHRIDLSYKEHNGTWIWEQVLEQIYVPTLADQY